VTSGTIGPPPEAGGTITALEVLVALDMQEVESELERARRACPVTLGASRDPFLPLPSPRPPVGVCGIEVEVEPIAVSSWYGAREVLILRAGADMSEAPAAVMPVPPTLTAGMDSAVAAMKAGTGPEPRAP
jgi:hypothetical protein